MPDAVVIGSGPNGLVAANILADVGWSVVVLEGADQPGGAVRSAELVEPGYVNDVCSAFYPLGAGSPVLAGLELERYGLEWCRAPLVLAHPTLDGICPVLSTDLDETAASLNATHPGDGDGWRRLYARWQEVSGALLTVMFTPTPPVRGIAQLATSMPPRDLVRLARFLLLPVRRMGEEEFGGDPARRLVAGAALHADLSPETPLSGFYGWLMCCLGQEVGFPVPRGGAGSLTAALVRRLGERGGKVLCGHRVSRIVTRGGRAVAAEVEGGLQVPAERAVLADVSAPALYRELLDPAVVPQHVLDDLRRFHWDNATVKVDWTLDAPIPWAAEPARRAGTVHVCEGLDALTEMASQLARGLIPEHPFLIVGQQAATDASRQPPGKETAWAYVHVPREVRGDAGGELKGTWDEAEAEAMADRMEQEIEARAPGFRRLVRGRHILTPPMFSRHNPNLDEGALADGTMQLHQQVVFRPVPGLGRPETPIRGLYLASASAHPGGGVHGACGSNAARAALAGNLRRRITSPARRVLDAGRRLRAGARIGPG
jgi:phytoene dehydrogenase-like protein